MVAAHEELVRPRVMTAVEGLVAQGASGVLEINGSPSGAIFLDGGRIAYARASWVPGLADRVRAIAPAVAGLEEPQAGGGADDAAAAGAAVRHGYLTPGRLHELIRSIVVDAFLVLTVPFAADSPVAAIRFTSTRTYWTELFPRLSLDYVRGEAGRRAVRMAEHGLAPTTAVALRDLRAPAAVLTREQWAVACQIGDHASARELAARRGAALVDTIDCLGSLTQVGLCGPVRVSGRARLSPVPGGAPSAGHPAQVPHAERLPVRRQARDQQPRQERPAGPGQPPTMDILRQVLSGLKKLS